MNNIAFLNISTLHVACVVDARKGKGEGKIARETRGARERKVTAKVLKDSLPATLPTLTNLINNSFSSNTFAQAWKSVEVIPIPKSDNHEDPANTRPISLLPIMSKVCERSCHSQFVDFLESNDIISCWQSGNRKHFSTETAMLYYTDELLKNIDGKKISIIVLLDTSKAFDSVTGQILWPRLQRFSCFILGLNFSILPSTFSTLPSLAVNSLYSAVIGSQQLSLLFQLPRFSKNWRLSMCLLRYDWSTRVARS